MYKFRMNKVAIGVLTCVFCFMGHLAMGQSMGVEKKQKNQKRQQIESQKVAFITKRLNLTVEEAQQFWPIYNEYQKKKDAITSKKRQLLKKMNNKKSSSLSDKSLIEASDAYIKLQVEEAQLESTYHEKFKATLPIKKVVAYYQEEERFKVWLLKQMQKNINLQQQQYNNQQYQQR